MAKKIKLNKSVVLFFEKEHKYYLNGKELSGITGIIGRYLFPNMYSNVRKETLAAAAAHGTLVHQQVSELIKRHPKGEELVDFTNHCEQEVRDYMELVKQNKIKMIESEYLVSNNESVASSIDIVDSNLNLYDIKTTDKLHTDSVSWQLSIYAYLFELQNPGLKAGKLYAIHLRDNKAKLVEVSRIKNEYVEQLITAYELGADTFDNPINTIGKDERTILEKYKNAKELAQRYADEADGYVKQIEEEMVKRDIFKIEKPEYKITRTISVKTSFDTKAFKEAKPVMYAKYCTTKQSVAKPLITFAKEK